MAEACKHLGQPTQAYGVGTATAGPFMCPWCEIERLRAGHCRDCCCARSWKALGFTEYTGQSIPEHIERLRSVALAARALVQSAQTLPSGRNHLEQIVSEPALTALEFALEAAGYGMSEEEAVDG